MRATALAYEAIRQDIVGGGLSPGERLGEEHLAARLGVSRTPVREALRRLAADGLVRFVPNHGAFVATVDRRALREVFEVRMMLEPEAAAMAATRFTSAGIASLRALATAMEGWAQAGARANMRAIATANTDFHRLIAEASGNTRLVDILGNLIEQVIVVSTFSRYSPAGMQRSMQHHAELLDAFDRRDPVWASSVMRSHVSVGLHAAIDGVLDDPRGELAGMPDAAA